jgi:hypothetical protein
MVDGCTIYDPAIYGLRVALGDERRSRPVEMLDLTYCSGDRDMRTHADTLMERVQPRKIRISAKKIEYLGLRSSHFAVLLFLTSTS